MSRPGRLRTRNPAVVASYQELVQFLRFYRHHGTPVIVGGWAVYFYNPYYGSVDIDVVGASLKGAFEGVIEKYETAHDYQFIRDPFGVEGSASKPIFKGKRKVGEMEIDACSYEHKEATRFHEDQSKTLPYSLCDRKTLRTEVRVASDAVCYVPSRELLALFKVKARRDRSFDVKERGATMNPERLAWLQGKVVKDGSDIIALLDPKPRRALLHESMDYAKLKDVAMEFGIKTMIKGTLLGVLEDQRALGLYGRPVDAQSLLKVVKGI